MKGEGCVVIGGIGMGLFGFFGGLIFGGLVYVDGMIVIRSICVFGNGFY